jgi:hypothetical protein
VCPFLLSPFISFALAREGHSPQASVGREYLARLVGIARRERESSFVEVLPTLLEFSRELRLRSIHARRFAREVIDPRGETHYPHAERRRL